MLRSRGLRSTQRVQARRRSFLLRLSALGVFVLVLVAGFSFLAHSERITVQDVVIRGAVSLHEEVLQSFVSERLSGAYLFLFPKNNIFLYPQTRIEEDLLDTHAELSSVAVSFENLQTVAVSLTERSSYGVWCGDLFGADEASRRCFYIDKEGVIYAEAPVFSPGVYFEFYGPVLGEVVRPSALKEKPVGFHFVSPQTFEWMRTFKEALESIGFFPYALAHKEGEDYDFIFKNGTRVMLRENQSAEEVLANLSAALETGELKKNHFTELNSNLDYADMRFKNRVYYKFK